MQNKGCSKPEVSKQITKRKWNREAIQKRERHMIRWATKEWAS